MMSFTELIKELDEKLEVTENYKQDNTIYINCQMPIEEHTCPHCHEKSSSVHSSYIRTIRDLSIQNTEVKLILKAHKYFCKNDKCRFKTFSEEFNFVKANAVRTNRLEDYINKIGLRDSSMDAVRTLKESGINVSSNTVLRIVKKKKNQR